MLYLILFLAFLFAAIFSFSVGFLINYHFKKLGIDNDKGAEKITKIYKKGAFLILLMGALSFILLFFSK